MAQVTSLRRENWTRSGPIVSRLPEDEIEILEDRAAAMIADPAPLGLWGFATGTWVTGTVIAGKFPETALIGTIPVLLIFAGIAQFIAGLIAFRRANILAASAFCCFGSFNVLTALLFALQSAGKLTTTGDPVILQGLILVSFGFIALALTLAALRTNAALVLTLLRLGHRLRAGRYSAVGEQRRRRHARPHRQYRRLVSRCLGVLCLLHRHGFGGEFQLAANHFSDRR